MSGVTAAGDAISWVGAALGRGRSRERLLSRLGGGSGNSYLLTGHVKEYRIIIALSINIFLYVIGIFGNRYFSCIK